MCWPWSKILAQKWVILNQGQKLLFTENENKKDDMTLILIGMFVLNNFERV